MSLRYPMLNALPSTATPNAAPSSRAVSLTADATPCLARGSDATIALVAGVIASAAPMPMTMVVNDEGQEAAPGAEASRTARTRRAEIASPAPPTRRWPYRSDSVPANADDREDHDGSWGAARARLRTCCSRARAAGTAATRRRTRTWRRTAGTATPSRWRSRGGGTDADRGAVRRCAARRSTNAARNTTPPTRPTRVSGLVQPRSGPSMMPSTSRPMPIAESDRTARIERRRARSPWCAAPRARRRGTPATASAGGDDEDRVPRELLEQRAGREDAERATGAGEAGPDADGLGPLLGREHAGDGGERARHEERGADAGERAQRDELAASSPTVAEQGGRQPEDGDAGDQARRGVRTGRRGRPRGAGARRASGRRRRRSTAATTGWRRGRRRCWACALASIDTPATTITRARHMTARIQRRLAYRTGAGAGPSGGAASQRSRELLGGTDRGGCGRHDARDYTRQRRMPPPDNKRRYTPFARGTRSMPSDECPRSARGGVP